MALIGVHHPKQERVAPLAAQRLFNSLLNKQSLRPHQNEKLESPCRREGIQFRGKCNHRRTKIWKKIYECCQERQRVFFVGPRSLCEQSFEFVPIHLASLSMPDLVWMSWHEIKTLKMHLGFLDLPTSSWLNHSVGELTWKVELEEPIQSSEGVNAIELVTDNTDTLRKVHFFGIPQNPFTDELTLGHPVAMNAQVAEIAPPEMGAVEADGIDPGHLFADIPSLDDLKVRCPYLGDDRTVQLRIVFPIFRTMKKSSPDDAIVDINRADIIDTVNLDRVLL